MRSFPRKDLPRLPLDGKLDLTYRCNNNCRHCWLWLPENSPEGKEELTFDEIMRIVNEARAMGAQAWSISGGEPMLRPDFSEIFEYITRKAVTYSLNTNGTLITPEIARLLQRRGNKMVALYGATSDVHDRVTRNPGSFEATTRGFAYLKEAGAGFTVQVIPMRANFHQYQAMLDLAQSLSSDYRVGSAWLFLTACHSQSRNREILRQRLDPADVVTIDPPNPASEALDSIKMVTVGEDDTLCSASQPDDRLFASCAPLRNDFHIDPYGQMSFCCFIKDQQLRYDLRRGNFQQAWDEFIPSLAGIVQGGEEYRENCGSCSLRNDCRWCGVYGYLEHGRYSARVEYLCQVAAENKRFKQEWKQAHLRYFQIAGITIQLSADFPLTGKTFDPKFDKFQVDGPADDTISIRLVSSIPAQSDLRLGKEFYRKAPWVIYRQPHAWVYMAISPTGQDQSPSAMAIFDEDHRNGSIYRHSDFFNLGRLESITTFPTDQILLARVMADRQAFFLHASGINLDGKGLLFVGHSEAGKSTIMKMLKGQGEILCDDRIIVRSWPSGIRIHGTWSHGELPDVSPASAPLHAILFLEKAAENTLVPVSIKLDRIALLLKYVIKPLVTGDWWEKTLELAGKIAAQVPIYRLRFDRSGKAVGILKQL